MEDDHAKFLFRNGKREREMRMELVTNCIDSLRDVFVSSDTKGVGRKKVQIGRKEGRDTADKRGSKLRKERECETERKENCKRTEMF